MGDDTIDDSEELSYQDQSSDHNGSDIASDNKLNQREADDSSLEALKLEFENAVQEIDRQLRVLNDLSKTSLKFSRTTLVFVGLLVTGVSLTDPQTLTIQIVDSPSCGIGSGTNCLSNHSLGLLLCLVTCLDCSCFWPYLHQKHMRITVEQQQRT